MKILITGAAGFIGFHLTQAMLNLGAEVVGIDNLNDYYDPALKNLRLEKINSHGNSYNFKFFGADISDQPIVDDIFKQYDFDVVVNLAAQAGVRYSIENPHTYINSNILGFLNILEGCRNSSVKHLVYASSSSVYGMNKKQPFSVEDRVDYPVSLYAATKRSNELMAYNYSHLFGIPSTGLRFFTVYGPYGRPDMAYYKFTKSILSGQKIDVYNQGEMVRDFTYIDDIVEGCLRVIKAPPELQSNRLSNSSAPHKILNIGNNNPITLRRFISTIEKCTGKKANENLLPMQPGDVPNTFADIDPLIEDYGFKPKTSIEDGMANFVEWFREYQKL
ncbi:NAD-dependent epimerase [Gammaproteobacteria bacterium]|nr:NAD-dependent epimerase [Gammaproteobacteria bacterium]MDC3398902.1 NAD-dependent epimerase [Gammaproteobacteria bacterium]